MYLKEGLCFFLSLNVFSAYKTPRIESMVYNEDYSIALRGARVSESSWTSSRLQPSVEDSNVACASACVDKYREDLSCNSIMYVRETRKCHMGNSTLANGNDGTEFVYRIPDGTGDMWRFFSIFI